MGEGRAVRFGAAWLLLLAAAAPAARALDLPGAFEFAPVADVPRVEEAGGLDVTVGLAGGFDSNPGRAEEADARSDGVLELLGGAAYTGGSSILRYRAAAEARAERFLDQDAYDLEEVVFRADIRWATGRARLSAAARHALLADPVEVDEFAFPLLERSETLVATAAEFVRGGTAVGVGYRKSFADYDEKALAYLDHTDDAASLDVSFGREGAPRCFLRFETGAVEFDVFDAAHPRADFDRERLYVGLRSGPARAQAFELGLGRFAVSGEGLEGDGLSVAARATRMFGEGTSALEAAYLRDAGAAATASFKTASRFLLRYTRRAAPRIRWSAGLRAQLADFTGRDPGTDASLSYCALDLGAAREIGSPSDWSGRLEARISAERGVDFSRVVLLVGMSLAR